MTAEEALDHKYEYMYKSEKLINKLRRQITISGSTELRVLRSLVNAEMANIRAKFYNDTSRDYSMKRKYLREAIKELPKTGWKFYYQRKYPGMIASPYIFYVILPDGMQVSWHGINYMNDMQGVQENYDIPWDGAQGVTLERIVNVIESTLNKG